MQRPTHHELPATAKVPAIRVTAPYINREIGNAIPAMDLFIDGKQLNSVAVTQKPNGTIHLDGIGQAIASHIAHSSIEDYSAPALIDAVRAACEWSALTGARA